MAGSLLTVDKPVLDACCGGRMFWFDHNDPRALYMDKFPRSHTLCDGRLFECAPDVVGDYTNMPFPDESFYMVVFDPPHSRRALPSSYISQKYGTLPPSFMEDFRAAFAECMRVLRPGGTLVFKWSEIEVPISRIAEVFPCEPLFGVKTPRRTGTHFYVFMKDPREYIHLPEDGDSSEF